jgi:hypothetical protein
MPGEHATPDTIAPQALPAGTRLGDFELLSVLGAGGFGIVYDVMDHALRRRVAIKEYMPGFLAGRAAQGQVSLLSQANLPTFESGLRSFVEEARLLAALDHPSLVKVYQFWKANGTAYFVMPFYEGQTLRRFRQAQSAPPGEGFLRAFLLAMLGALDVLHRQKIVHRDIAPDNIILTADEQPILLDFGSARQTIEGQTQKLTAVLKLGYAPIEQYDDTSIGLQGPWTDVYALGGTLHFAITGRSPPPAQIRMLRDELQPLAAMPGLGISSEFLAVVDWMLALRPETRPQSAEAVRQALRDGVPDAQRTRAPVADPDATVLLRPGGSTIRADERGGPAAADGAAAAGAGGRRPTGLMKSLLLAAAGAVVVAGGLWFGFSKGPDAAAPASASVQPSVQAPLPPAPASAMPAVANAPTRQPAPAEPAAKPGASKRADAAVAVPPSAGPTGKAADAKPQAAVPPAAAPETAVKASEAGAGPAGPAGAAGAVSSPLARCKLDFPGESVETCLAGTCNQPEYRFHAVCLRFQREAAEKR